MLNTLSLAQADYRRDLGDGLILRWSTAEDTENIARQVGHVFRSKAEAPANAFLETQVRRVMRGDTPLMGTGDYALVEDTYRRVDNPIIAGVNLWRQECDYEGVPFGLGRPEFVFTHGNYRRRGLIRSLFELIHARSAAAGHLVQGITGIHYFYRQFGYEYALDMDGFRATTLSLIPALKEQEQEAFSFQEATVADIPLLQSLYTQRRTRSRSIVWTHISDNYWHHLLEGWKQPDPNERLVAVQMIVDAENRKIGYILLRTTRRDQGIGVVDLEVAQGSNWLPLLPALLRLIQAYALHIPASNEQAGPLKEIRFELGRDHPLYHFLGQDFTAKEEPPYAWYIRVADLPAFLKHIAPALEQRLADSELAGYTGELRIDFYQRGLKLVFTRGKLELAENWQVPIYDSQAHAGFPPLLFLQVVFGYRSVDELKRVYPDVWSNPEGSLLLQALFPTRPSYMFPLF